MEKPADEQEFTASPSLHTRRNDKTRWQTHMGKTHVGRNRYQLEAANDAKVEAFCKSFALAMATNVRAYRAT